MAFMMRPTTTPSARTSKSSSLHSSDKRLMSIEKPCASRIAQPSGSEGAAAVGLGATAATVGLGHGAMVVADLVGGCQE